MSLLTDGMSPRRRSLSLTFSSLGCTLIFLTEELLGAQPILKFADDTKGCRLNKMDGKSSGAARCFLCRRQEQLPSSYLGFQHLDNKSSNHFNVQTINTKLKQVPQVVYLVFLAPRFDEVVWRARVCIFDDGVGAAVTHVILHRVSRVTRINGTIMQAQPKSILRLRFSSMRGIGLQDKVMMKLYYFLKGILLL